MNPHGAGKKIKGEKRHILVDTIGFLLHALVHPAAVQYRDSGVLVLRTISGNSRFRDARKKASPFVDTEIIERSDAAEGWPGVRKPQSQSAVVAAPRLHPPHAQKTL
jgi:hypothetical protein